MDVKNLIKNIFKAVHKPGIVLDEIFTRTIGGWFSDKLYLQIRFRLKMGYALNLTNPRNFSEKLQWLKLYDHNPQYTQMVDKYAAKHYVAQLIGEEYIIPTIGVWERAEDIDWDSLPNRFVLKCTHDSATVTIVLDKGKIDKLKVVKKYSKLLKRNYYKRVREWPYKNVPHRIIAETYIEPAQGTDDLPDYKFFCFSGKPAFCQVISGRGKRMCIDFFNRDWHHLPFHEPRKFPFATIEPAKPLNLDTMWRLAECLSVNKSFSRIDFYNIDGKIYFGEITFFPTSGMGGFAPQYYDRIVGDMIHLPKVMNS